VIEQGEHVTLTSGAVLYEARQPLSHVWFPNSGTLSVVKVMKDGTRVEVATVGQDGMASLVAFFGEDTPTAECFVQMPGEGTRMTLAAFRAATLPGRPLYDVMQRFARYEHAQMSQTIACNRLHSVPERCARWLLLTHDRAAGTEEPMPLTHEFIAIMLGVRRASVSLAAEALQRDGLIRYSRGKVKVLDRAGLETAACECYACDRSDLVRLFRS
jgi:CRP-like cAMP-binding protein